MTHTYNLTGMTCSSCESKVRSALLTLEHVTDVEVSKENQTATLSMDKHIALSDLQKVLDSKYRITPINHNETAEQARSWIETYKPVLLIFFLITLITVSVQLSNPQFNIMQWMRHFMAGFFLVFSFFKLLNLKGFAESYSMYDIIAKRLPAWGYMYAFIELILGMAFLLNFDPLITNSATLLIMSVSIVGVIQSYNKPIRCACLGAVFNLPMSTITILEDALMIVMSAMMIAGIL
jgi:cation transport ATPase